MVLFNQHTKIHNRDIFMWVSIKNIFCFHFVPFKTEKGSVHGASPFSVWIFMMSGPLINWQRPDVSMYDKTEKPLHYRKG